MIRALITLVTQELARPRQRHPRPDPLAYVEPSKPVASPSWPRLAAETARTDLDRTLRAFVRGFASEGSVRSATITWIEASR